MLNETGCRQCGQPNGMPAHVAHSSDDDGVVPFSIDKWSPFRLSRFKQGCPQRSPSRLTRTPHLKHKADTLDRYGTSARHVDPAEAFRRGGGQRAPQQGRQQANRHLWS